MQHFKLNILRPLKLHEQDYFQNLFLLEKQLLRELREHKI